jgi:hypothetical protein
MFLRSTIRKKDGKQHRYWSVVETKRVSGGRIVQKHVLYLGEINGSQELAWRKSIAVLEDGDDRPKTLALFPAGHCEGVLPDASIVRLKLSALRLSRPRQWGACWLALHLWEELRLDRFWADRLAPSRKGTRWDQELFVLVAYRLLAPGSEWRLHRYWFERTALADLLGADFGLAEIHKLYRCHDRLLEHKAALFDHLVDRWRDLFNARFDILLYDLTSTYFESEPPFPDGDKRRFGYLIRQSSVMRVPPTGPPQTPEHRMRRKHLPLTDPVVTLVSLEREDAPQVSLPVAENEWFWVRQTSPWKWRWEADFLRRSASGICEQVGWVRPPTEAGQAGSPGHNADAPTSA